MTICDPWVRPPWADPARVFDPEWWPDRMWPWPRPVMQTQAEAEPEQRPRKRTSRPRVRRTKMLP